MAELSPAAAILAAFRERYDETLRPGPFVGRWQATCLAAALEALVDQVVPESACEAPDWTTAAPGDFVCAETQLRVRRLILAIASELRGEANG